MKNDIKDCNVFITCFGLINDIKNAFTIGSLTENLN